MRYALAILLLGGSLVGCGGENSDRVSDIAPDSLADADANPDISSDIDLAAPAADGLRLRMPTGPRERLFDGPVPSLDLAADGGERLLRAWPGVSDVPWLEGLIPLLPPCGAGGCGASLGGAFFLPLEGLDDDAREHLERAGERILAADAPIADTGLALVAFAPDAAAEPGAPAPSVQRLPMATRFLRDGGPHGAPDLLVVKPLPGVPLPPRHAVAVLVGRALADIAGRPPGRPEALSRLLSPPSGALPPGERLARQLLMALAEGGEVSPEALVGLAIAETGDPAATFLDAAARAVASEAATLGAPTPLERHAGFCVLGLDGELPDFQAGTPPFEAPGDGAWQVDDDGAPILARRAPSRVFLTVPETARPGATLPVAVFVRTGGGGDRPLIDRGVRAVAGGPASPPTGAGPAAQIAEAGWVGATWDGPHGGPRNPGDADEQFLMFNVLNPAAAIGNVQQTALEASLFRRALDGRRVPTCDGDGEITLDASAAALVGHSMGAWVAPLALALDPGFDAAVLSGAGGGWVENIAFKERPLHVRPLAELILGYDGIDRTLTPFDPALTLLQWAGEAADPQAYGARAMTPPRDVLVIQGVVDHYILPPIAAALQVAMGLDLAGPALDAADPRLEAFTPLADLLAHAGRHHLTGPVTANRDGRTAVVVQLAEDGVEDGHEAFFQRPEARRLLTCFLADLAAGRSPTIDRATETGPCPGR
jgi:hypothetical protein